MSIYGRRVDAFFTRRTHPTSRTDYNRAGLNAIWQVLLVIAVAAFALWLMANHS